MTSEELPLNWRLFLQKFGFSNFYAAEGYFGDSIYAAGY
jgi:hypothetical protein